MFAYSFQLSLLKYEKLRHLELQLVAVKEVQGEPSQGHMPQATVAPPQQDSCANAQDGATADPEGKLRSSTVLMTELALFAKQD